MPHIPCFRLLQRLVMGLTLMLSPGLATGGRAADATITVTDLAGRSVKVKKGVQRAILGEGRLFLGPDGAPFTYVFRRVGDR